MSLENIIDAAESHGFTRTHSGDVELWLCNKNDIERFAQHVAKEMRAYMVFHAHPTMWMEEHVLAEREACAKVCDDRITHEAGMQREDYENRQCAIAIRARGEA